MFILRCIFTGPPAFFCFFCSFCWALICFPLSWARRVGASSSFPQVYAALNPRSAHHKLLFVQRKQCEMCFSPLSKPSVSSNQSLALSSWRYLSAPACYYLFWRYLRFLGLHFPPLSAASLMEFDITPLDAPAPIVYKFQHRGDIRSFPRLRRYCPRAFQTTPANPRGATGEQFHACSNRRRRREKEKKKKIIYLLLYIHHHYY